MQQQVEAIAEKLVEEKSGCEKSAPTNMDDPVCVSGRWIEKSKLEDPAFWACGEPPQDIEYPICDFDTGLWEEGKPET